MVVLAARCYCRRFGEQLFKDDVGDVFKTKPALQHLTPFLQLSTPPPTLTTRFLTLLRLGYHRRCA